MRFAVISTSLNPHSKSILLAQILAGEISKFGHEVDLIDLRETPLPLCDGAGSFENETVKQLKTRLEHANGLLIAAPIYNWDVGAVTKNLIELVGGAFENKVVGIACAAGGSNAFMAPLGLLNSLMLDFRTVVVPRYVYAADNQIDSPQIAARLSQLATMVIQLTTALSPGQEREVRAA